MLSSFWMAVQPWWVSHSPQFCIWYVYGAHLLWHSGVLCISEGFSWCNASRKTKLPFAHCTFSPMPVQPKNLLTDIDYLKSLWFSVSCLLWQMPGVSVSPFASDRHYFHSPQHHRCYCQWHKAQECYPLNIIKTSSRSSCLTNCIWKRGISSVICFHFCAEDKDMWGWKDFANEERSLPLLFPTGFLQGSLPQ